MAKKKKSVNPTKYVKVSSVPKAPAAYTPGTYTSQYQGQLDSALDKVVNWKYDPLQDASYQALAKIYGARGNQAAKDTLADAASLNGGYGTSYAVSAAQQARNQYNQELAALIPDLENTAYTRATGTLNALRDADDTAYGRFRDTEGDRQWGYEQNYKQYQDALGQYQWARNFNLDLYGLKKSSAGSSGGGGGGRGGRSGGGGGYSGGGSAGNNNNSDIPTVTPSVTHNPNSVVYYKSSDGSVNNQSKNPAYMAHGAPAAKLPKKPK